MGWAFLIAYSLLLACRAYCLGAPGATVLPPLWGGRDSHWVVGSIAAITLGALEEFALFAPVGFGAALLVSAGSAGRRRRRIHFPCLAGAIAFTVLACGTGIVRSWRLAAVAGLAFPLLGCIFGTWAGATWLRGWRARLWFGPKVALGIAMMALGAGIVATVSLEDAPLSFEAAHPDPGEKQRLMHLVRGEAPGSAEEDETHTVRLTEHDANVLLSWGLSSESQERKAAVRLSEDSVLLQVSLPVHLQGERPRHLNVKAVANVEIKKGNLRLHVERLRIGSLDCPGPILRVLTPLAASALNHGRQVRPFLNAIGEMTIEPNTIQFTYRPMDLPLERSAGTFRPSLVSEELRVSTRIHVDHLLLLAAGPLPDLQPSFNLCLKAAFTLARDRSAQHDAVVENQAALLALGILLGHPQIDEVVAAGADGAEDDAARKALTGIGLHGRSDWTRHFCVSAAIAVLSGENTSDTCGRLKEELDADAGGSGFSFADLLVNRAGAAFAVRATRDTAAARALQDRLCHGFAVAEICPSADDLPEGLSEADLQSRYGGEGGEGYRRLVEEIERRIAACAAYN